MNLHPVRVINANLVPIEGTMIHREHPAISKYASALRINSSIQTIITLNNTVIKEYAATMDRDTATPGFCVIIANGTLRNCYRASRSLNSTTIYIRRVILYVAVRDNRAGIPEDANTTSILNNFVTTDIAPGNYRTGVIYVDAAPI